jgi:hypothetical protein
MTEAEARAISDDRAVVRDGRVIGVNSGRRQVDGLTLHVQRDDTGREIRTWTGSKSVWMAPFKAPRYLQTVLSRDTAWNKRVHAERLAAMGIES